ncbi:uncharacterized protein LOC119092270 [Pollicipes pollicipes]|uniref:uncharacterized protein LOC119092270 n=1 Tax=Pollicipes pollicipes TaxID=41117 RepID=UPI0018856C41|nr:uncharacterized protein LOC119092270 [Pollicipes pollicipes]
MAAPCLGECYFPFEYHGTYAVQSARNQYSEVLIEINRILPYGVCHRRVGNNLILRDGSNGCLRCFHLAIRSANVLQLHTRDPQSSCATNSNATLRLCPTPDELRSAERMQRGRIHELMMYKTKTRTAEPHAHQVYCPISGRFSFSYEADEAGGACRGAASELSNCPYGFGLHLHFRACSFRQQRNMTLQCLADWTDADGRHFVALMDVTASESDRPRYRCAMYREELGSGRIFLAFSSDSSCHRQLVNATHGHERLVLYAAVSHPWPPAVRRATCTFPDWAQGHWQHAHVDGNTIVYKDVANFKSYTARCIGGQHEKFVIYSRSHCGEEMYNCIWLKERAVNVMEFQLGLMPSRRISNSLCGPHRFLDTGWITQGRSRIEHEARCPVSGSYSGVIPDTDGQLCARLSSDCTSSQSMFYTVTSCANASHIFEKREYRCLGSWTEGDVLYTYTQRRDALSYECFVGRVMADGRVFIGEAGTDEGCRRRVDPTRTGMLITQTAPCRDGAETSEPPPPTVSAPTLASLVAALLLASCFR